MTAIDTNILVYAFDEAYPEKRKRAKQIVTEIFQGKRKVFITNQILAEFASVITKKIEKPVSKESAEIIIGAILSSENWKIQDYTGETILSALKSSKPFWDALIIETLKEAKVTKIITEDEKGFSSELEIENPFKA